MGGWGVEAGARSGGRGAGWAAPRTSSWYILSMPLAILDHVGTVLMSFRMGAYSANVPPVFMLRMKRMHCRYMKSGANVSTSATSWMEDGRMASWAGGGWGGGGW